jgi:hypothetical protein
LIDGCGFPHETFYGENNCSKALNSWISSSGFFANVARNNCEAISIIDMSNLAKSEPIEAAQNCLLPATQAGKLADGTKYYIQEFSINCLKYGTNGSSTECLMDCLLSYTDNEHNNKHIYLNHLKHCSWARDILQVIPDNFKLNVAQISSINSSKPSCSTLSKVDLSSTVSVVFFEPSSLFSINPTDVLISSTGSHEIPTSSPIEMTTLVSSISSLQILANLASTSISTVTTTITTTTTITISPSSQTALINSQDSFNRFHLLSGATGIVIGIVIGVIITGIIAICFVLIVKSRISHQRRTGTSNDIDCIEVRDNRGMCA